MLFVNITSQCNSKSNLVLSSR